MTQKRPVSTPGQQGSGARPLPSESEKPLSAARAFVVQFREPAAGAAVRFAGRVEHMISGQAARFDSAEDLVAFLVGVLGAQPAVLTEEE